MAATLCIRCSQLPFQDLFWASSHDAAIGPVTQGHSSFRGEESFTTFGDLWKEDSCVFCALLKKTLEAFYTSDLLQQLVHLGDETGLQLYKDPLDLSWDRFAKFEGSIPLSLRVTINYSPEFKVPPGNEGSSLDMTLPTTDITLDPYLIALRNSTTSAIPPCTQFGREVVFDKIDWSIVRRWIDSCLKHTADDVASGFDNTKALGLRAIDVIDGCVVELPPRAQYVALSYVWGKDQRVKLYTHNLAQLSSKGYLHSATGRPSKTIVDAAHVVRRLGYRYLWVDALCIIQDDLQNLEENIKEMDIVYSRAVFTIAAVAGTDADYGLPGVSPETPRTQKQHHAAINGVHIVNRLQSDINSTWWNTRGWTYQERVLPRRLLFFSDVQVEYRCEGDCSFQEQFHDAHDGPVFSMFDSVSNLDFTDTNLFAVYAKAVAEYTRRSITNPMDKVKAFQGILERLRAPFQAPFLFGLPVSLFDVGLLWFPIGSISRGNQVFPSWSWAGWTGPVCWSIDENASDDLINICESTVSICTISLGNSAMRLCSDSSPDTGDPQSRSWERHFDDMTQEIYYLSQSQSNKGYRYPRPLDSLLLSTYNDITDTKNTVLKIQGRIATMKLTGQHSPGLGHKCKQGIHERCKLAVLDDKNRVAGTIVVDGDLVPQLQGRTHQFLGLSRSTYLRVGDLDEDEPTWDQEKNEFHPWTDTWRSPKERDDVLGDYWRPLENWIAEPCSNSDDSVRSPPVSGKDWKYSTYHYTTQVESNWELNNDSFDQKEFSSKVPWPRVNVLLLSQETNGCVERIGCGDIHIDAFMPASKASTVLLR
ncbi:heterokaryon incompatibility protein-domain-containing protein [Xylaria arbuscula]|nr:heterokaryon incompatibility protein-domain-containing protein [Xylaria arbuscula]